MADRYDDDRHTRDYPYNTPRFARDEHRDDHRDRHRGDHEHRSFDAEGDRDAGRRDRYGSRYDQDRTAYGSGYDASRRDYGRGADQDHSEYLSWRDEQLRGHDRDYAEWRANQHRQYDNDYHQFRGERRHHFGHTFHQWRAQRNLTGGMLATDIAPGLPGGYAGMTAHAGGLTADQDRPGGSYEPYSQHTHHGDDQGRAAGSGGAVDTGSEFGKEPPEVQATTDGSRKVDRK
jgi:hypothetical protein